jgi:hypothetical protein
MFGTSTHMRRQWFLGPRARVWQHRGRGGCGPTFRPNPTAWSTECAVLFGGGSFGSACHWHPVEKLGDALRTSRTFTSRRRPPRLAGGIIGSTSARSACVRSLGYSRPCRSAAWRCSGFHLSVPHKESRTSHLTQQFSGSALKLGGVDKCDPVPALVLPACKPCSSISTTSQPR